MSKEKLKNRGITLIALIITIIVMLILTGVTLSITLGDNGLVNKAKEAALQMEIEQDREELLSAVVGAIGIDGKVNFTYLDSHLPAGFTGSNGTYTSENGHKFTVSENGEVLYTGAGTPGDDIIDNGDGSQIGAVTLNGKYYISDEEEYKDFYYEIVNLNTFVDYVDSDGVEIPIIIDEENNKISFDRDNFGNFSYKYIEKNGEIVNIILLDWYDSGCAIYWQNRNGFEYDLDGVYLYGDSWDSKLVFDAETGTVIDEWYNGTSMQQRSGIYFKVADMYYCFIEGDTYLFDDFSDDLTTLTTIDGDTYTKESEEELPLIERTLTSMYQAGLTCTEENCTNDEHLHIGDYVKYTPDPAGPYYPDGQEIGSKTAYTTDVGATELQTVNQETLNWRVIGYDEADDQVVILSDGTKNETITFQGMVRGENWNYYGGPSSQNYINVIENVCSSLYGKADVGTARSVTMNDLKKYFGVVYEEPNMSSSDGSEVPEGLVGRYEYNPADYILDSNLLEIWMDSSEFWIGDVTWSHFGSANIDSYGRIGPSLNNIFLECSVEICYQGDTYIYGIRPLVELDSAVTNTQVRKITN